MDLPSSTCSCGEDLGLTNGERYPPGTYFESGDKGSVSFRQLDLSRFKQKERSKWGPFFETWDSWGIQRNQTLLLCAACGKHVGYVCADGPPLYSTTGFGPSQVVPRHNRYRILAKALEQPAKVANGKP